MSRKMKTRVVDVEISNIREPKAMIRMEIDSDYIEELAQSISETGLLQPILLAVDGDGFEIVAGHCRVLAHKKIGLSKIKAVVREMTAVEIGLARATENIARLDLTPLEEAATYRNLVDEYGMTVDKISQKMGKSPGTIKRRMDLMRMPPVLQKAVHKKEISMTVAEELWPISDMGSLDYYLIFAIENGCTKEVARQWAKDWRDSVRRSDGAGGEGGLIQTSLFEPRPTYFPCDVCLEPVELGETQVMRVCPSCYKIIKKGMEVTK